jgi:hypothetical protein
MKAQTVTPYRISHLQRKFEVWGSESDLVEDFVLFGYDDASFVSRSPMFRRNLVLSSSGVKKYKRI